MGITNLRTAGALMLSFGLPAALWAVEDNRVDTKRFAIAAGSAPEIVVSIVTGNIKVVAHAGSEVVMTAKVHYGAADGADLAELQKRVRLESEQQGNNVWIGLESDDWNGGSSVPRRPREFGWRNRTSEKAGSRGDNGRRWRFRHDVELQVPQTAHLKLSTVNGGSIDVSGVAGEFSFNNVNGGIEVKDADGFGRAHTVNGPISISYQRNPTGATSIKTVNGKITLGMRAGLNADVKVKTLNGKIYTDFAALSAASAESASQTSANGMKRIWRTDRTSSLRIGSGGPEIRIDGLNGDIQILERKN